MAELNFKESAQEIVRLVGGKENVNGVTHCVTRVRFKAPCGNIGMGGIKEYPVPERTPSNGAEWDQFYFSDKLRTRRPGVRIPQKDDYFNTMGIEEIVLTFRTKTLEIAVFQTLPRNAPFLTQ